MFRRNRKGDDLEKAEKELKGLQLQDKSKNLEIDSQKKENTPLLSTRKGRFDLSEEDTSYLLENVFGTRSPEQKAFEALKDFLKTLIQEKEDTKDRNASSTS